MSTQEKFKKPLTLSIDIGGTSIKTMVLDADGKTITNYLKEPTPHPATPEALCRVIKKMIQILNTDFDRASAGYPGVVQHGIIRTAANLDPSFIGVDFQKRLHGITGVPTRLANDADVQGYGDISGKGVELVITLGTGFGSALFVNGHLVPNLELGHHPFMSGLTYEEVLGKKAFEKTTVDDWCAKLLKAIALLDKTFNYDHLYIGGGYANMIDVELPKNITIAKNIEGVLGGIELWKE